MKYSAAAQPAWSKRSLWFRLSFPFYCCRPILHLNQGTPHIPEKFSVQRDAENTIATHRQSKP
jgi:hypothetical protein